MNFEKEKGKLIKQLDGDVVELENLVKHFKELAASPDMLTLKGEITGRMLYQLIKARMLILEMEQILSHAEILAFEEFKSKSRQ